MNTLQLGRRMTIFDKLKAARSRIAPIAIDVITSGHRMFLADVPLILIFLMLLARTVTSLVLIGKIIEQEI